MPIFTLVAWKEQVMRDSREHNVEAPTVEEAVAKLKAAYDYLEGPGPSGEYYNGGRAFPGITPADSHDGGQVWALDPTEIVDGDEGISTDNDDENLCDDLDAGLYAEAMMALRKHFSGLTEPTLATLDETG